MPFAMKLFTPFNIKVASLSLRPEVFQESIVLSLPSPSNIIFDLFPVINIVSLQKTPTNNIFRIRSQYRMHAYQYTSSD